MRSKLNKFEDVHVSQEGTGLGQGVPVRAVGQGWRVSVQGTRAKPSTVGVPVW